VIFQAKLDFQYDTQLPTDAMTITPHFFGDNAQGLADALKTNLLGVLAIGPSTPFKIRIYDAQKPPPSYPLAEAQNVAGNKAYGAIPREVAICLSYYSTWNRPRYRGRLFLPAAWVGAPIGARPTQGQRDLALSFKNALSTGLPASHNWVVYSRVGQQANGVSDCWVDDEWDIVRSRGLRGTARSVGTVP
jgi:hypothetical protein